MTEAKIQDAIEAAFLFGDIRDAILSEFKLIDRPWQKMTEIDQDRLIFRAGAIAGDLVTGAVAVLAKRGFAAVPTVIEQFTRKDGLKIVLMADAGVDHITKLAEHGMQAAVLVLAEPTKYMGERKPTEPDNVGDLAMPRTGNGAEATAQ